jgi:23S rRNA pseudouridine1911/1915/1917 synthase
MKIIVETEQYIVLHKPAGLLVEASPHFPSVEAWVMSYLKAKDTRKNPFVGIVHRLDRPVSGVLLVAKKKSYLKAFNEQFRLRSVEKIYRAWVQGKPPSANATVEHWLITDPKLKKSLIVVGAQKNASAVRLSYTTIVKETDKTLLEISLHTGKFHQIRAQMAALGCPIVGDEKYGATLRFQQDAIALEAFRLSVNEPMSGERLTFEV